MDWGRKCDSVDCATIAIMVIMLIGFGLIVLAAFGGS
jgi:hypothetical protein